MSYLSPLTYLSQSGRLVAGDDVHRAALEHLFVPDDELAELAGLEAGTPRGRALAELASRRERPAGE